MTRLRQARVNAGLSLQQAARAVGLSPATLRQAESRGLPVLAWPRVQKLARLYAANLLDFT